jgi:hypothetical protein
MAYPPHSIVEIDGFGWFFSALLWGTDEHTSQNLFVAGYNNQQGVPTLPTDQYGSLNQRTPFPVPESGLRPGQL